MMNRKIEDNEVRNYFLTPEWWIVQDLERRGCSADDWADVRFAPGLDTQNISNVRFRGKVTVDEGAVLRNIPGGISNCHVGKNTLIENVGRIEFEEEAPCGVGISIATLDETGSRPVRAYPGLSSQVATLMTRCPSWLEQNLLPDFQDFLDSRMTPHEIGDNSIVRDCGRLLNVSIGRDITVEGAHSLVNGSIINNAPYGSGTTYVGFNVDAENFIFEDALVDSGSIVRDCYVGQGAQLRKGFTAHDSCFFANCSFENGEACAVLAGPYSVSMHKASLVIGCQTSFMNAGSATNESNHTYKLGPVHWGLLERGVKTASGAYIMFGAKIGAFSLVMGSHKTHPDSSSFPFSYLFGDERGATVVVPAVMLRSCGLMRDEQKWPARDRRIKRRLPLHDRVHYSVLNPFTVDAMLNAIDNITELLALPADDDLYLRYKGMKFTRAALERAKYIYSVAIFKFLSLNLEDGRFGVSDNLPSGEWVDLGGQIIMRETLDRVLATDSVQVAEQILNEAFESYETDSRRWINRRFGEWWRSRESRIKFVAEEFDELVEADRKEYLDSIAAETRMLSL